MTREVSDLQNLQHYIIYIFIYFTFFANFVEHRRVFSRPEDGPADVEDKGVSRRLRITTSLII